MKVNFLDRSKECLVYSDTQDSFSEIMYSLNFDIHYCFGDDIACISDLINKCTVSENDADPDGSVGIIYDNDDLLVEIVFSEANKIESDSGYKALVEIENTIYAMFVYEDL